MKTMTLTASGVETTVKVERETKKAILVSGNASEAWFPKKAIDADGQVASWFRGTLVHSFLWSAPYDPNKNLQGTTGAGGYYNVNHGTGTACWNVEDDF
jgi:hypothetical protein